MIDTLNIQLTAAEVEGVDFLNEIAPHLNPEGVALHDYRGDQVLSGDLNGLKVTASSWQLRVGGGSLCKWMLGDNFSDMTRGDIQRAVERLSDELHQPIARATVKRLDIASNIITRYPTDVYLNHLGVLQYANRLMQPHSLYYTRPDITLCFYDKVREQRDKREPIPELYRDCNVLRYEQRFTRRLGKTFKRERVTAADLYDEMFYIVLLNRWREGYRAIKKINDVTLNFQAMKNKQQLYRMGVLSMVERVGGEVEMLAHITEAQKRGDLTKKQAFDLRQAVKEACKEREGLTTPSDAIAELDKKIAEAIRFYR